MNKDDFKVHTRYTVTLRDSAGRLRPANLYTYKVYAQFMIVRLTEHSGLLHRIDYDAVVKIVKTREIPKEDQFYIPEAILKENAWATRTSMAHYSTSPHMGK